LELWPEAKTYTSFFSPTASPEMRFGVIRAPIGRDTDPSGGGLQGNTAAVTNSLKVLVARGAEVIDPLDIPNIKELVAAASGAKATRPKPRIDAFLARQPNAPVHSLPRILASPLVIAKRREELSRDLGHTTKDVGYFKETSARKNCACRSFA